MNLALLGGKPVIDRRFSPFNTIDFDEIEAVQIVLKHFPLSGFLGGQERGGHLVCKLEKQWAEAFGIKHAIACNSATSGLLAACHAAGVGIGSRVLTTPFTMSATSAVPASLGATLIYGDIEPTTFNLSPSGLDDKNFPQGIHACIVTNLFGHPAELFAWRELSRKHGFVLIEDSAQTPFATIGQTGKIYAGTVGDIGVFSFNVHKHLQCGEGGMVVTDDDGLALAVRHYINHGELAGSHRVGLNLRMTEVTAAIALKQLEKAPAIISDRRKQAIALSGMTMGHDWITPPEEMPQHDHVYYAWAAKFNMPGVPNYLLLMAIRAEGFPINTGYVAPLYRLPAFARFAASCPVAEAMHDKVIGCFENCAYTLSENDIMAFGTVLDKIEANAAALRGVAGVAA